LLNRDKRTVHEYCEKFKAQKNLVQHLGQPPLFTAEAIEEIPSTIIKFHSQRRPFSGQEIKDVPDPRYQKSVRLD
jgi:hypothetical protein